MAFFRGSEIVNDMFRNLGEVCEAAFTAIVVLTLLVSLGPIVRNLLGLLLLSILGAPLWFVTSLIF